MTDKAISIPQFLACMREWCEKNTEATFDEIKEYAKGVAPQRVVFEALQGGRGIINGVVFETNQWSIIALPPIKPTRYIPYKHLRKNMDDYDVYRIKDGTTTTLYHYNGKLCMSSTNGYEINSYKFISSETTFEDALRATASEKDINLDEIVAEDESLTIGFHHSSIHPMNGIENDIWFIQSAKVGSSEPTFDSHKNLSREELLPTGSYTYRSIDNAIKASIPNYLKNGDINFGYILRSKVGSQDILWCSRLYQNLRFFIYSLPRKVQLYPVNKERININQSNRLALASTFAYLSHNNVNLFHCFFPEIAEKYYPHLHVLQEKLADKVLECLRNRNVYKNIQDSDDYFNTFIRIVVNYLKDKHGISGYTPEAKKIITDFLRDKSHAGVMLYLLLERLDVSEE